MSIAAANLWTRNIYKEYIHRGATPREEARQAKFASLVVKVGAVLFIVAVDPQFSVDLQLIGGVIILMTLPAVAIALYTRWFHRWALVAGWAAGMAWGMYLLYQIPNPSNGKQHFGGSALALDKLSFFGWAPWDGSTRADLRRLRGAHPQHRRLRRGHVRAARDRHSRGPRPHDGCGLPRDARPRVHGAGGRHERVTGPYSGP